MLRAAAWSREVVSSNVSKASNALGRCTYQTSTIDNEWLTASCPVRAAA
jgi:hypothetical protein